MSRGPAQPWLREARQFASTSDPRIVVVAAVLGFAALVAGCPKGGGGSEIRSATVKQMELVHGQIEAWAQEQHRAPSQEQGLAVVFNGTTPRDGWGNELVYLVPGPDGWAFELVSFGSDGAPGGRGDAADLVWSEMHQP